MHTFQNLTGLLLSVRGKLDDLWFALEDATNKDGCFPPEDNRKGGRAAAYEALQSIRAIERELDDLVRGA